MADIKLFVCCHQQSAVPKHPLLVPIQVGAALSDRRFPGFIPDDTRWNISEKNRSYCELNIGHGKTRLRIFTASFIIVGICTPMYPQDTPIAWNGPQICAH